MPEFIVQPLEMTEINKNDCGTCAVPSRQRDRGPQSIEHQHPIGKLS
jgi:hypothetical protein